MAAAPPSAPQLLEMVPVPASTGGTPPAAAQQQVVLCSTHREKRRSLLSTFLRAEPGMLGAPPGKC